MSCSDYSSSSPFFDPVSKKCVSTCPDTAPAVNVKFVKSDYDYVCRSCSEVYPTAKVPLYWNPNTRECVTQCPAATPERGTIKICSACQDISSTYTIWDTKTEQCVTSCSE